jgi:hypothetical protein
MGAATGEEPEKLLNKLSSSSLGWSTGRRENLTLSSRRQRLA